LIYPPATTDFTEKVIEFTQEKDIILIDYLGEYFSSFPQQELVIENDGHPTAFAHKLVAERIFYELNKSSLI